MVPGLGEPTRTVGRVERRPRDRRAAEPLRAYPRVGERFRKGLADPRDLLLSQAAALMRVQGPVRAEEPRP